MFTDSLERAVWEDSMSPRRQSAFLQPSHEVRCQVGLYSSQVLVKLFLDKLLILALTDTGVKREWKKLQE